MLESRKDREVTIAELEDPYEERNRTLTAAAAHARVSVDVPVDEVYTALGAGAAWIGCLVPAAAGTGSCLGTEVVGSGSEMPEPLALPSLRDGRLILRRSQKRLLRCPRGRRRYRSDSPASSLLT